MPTEVRVRACGFFEILRPVFERNAKWSKAQPVPDLGDENTPVEEVQEFYDFWFSFESWREPSGTFLHACGMQIEETVGLRREERRMVEKHNDKLRRKFAMQEGSRIYDMVCLARRLDPRLAGAERRTGRRVRRDAR